jgi:hypothetical protein
VRHPLAAHTERGVAAGGAVLGHGQRVTPRFELPWRGLGGVGVSVAAIETGDTTRALRDSCRKGIHQRGDAGVKQGEV